MNNRRGPYFKYLKELVNIPRATLLRRQQMQNNFDDAEAVVDQNEIAGALQNNVMMELDDSSDVLSDQLSNDDELSNVSYDQDEHMEQRNNSPIDELIHFNTDSEVSDGSDTDDEDNHYRHRNFLFHDVEAAEENILLEDNEQLEINAEVDDPNNDAENIIVDNNLDERTPIYEGAPITKEESNNLIMGLAVRHCLTDVCIEDVLGVIDCHLPSTLHSSKYLFFKQFPQIVEAIPHYYCPDCMVELILENNTTIVQCTACEKEYILNSLRRNGNYFMHLPLKKQLQKLFSGPLYNELQVVVEEDDNATISGIMSGAVYKSLKEGGIISENDITAQIHLDGVQAFKSSKVSMCPVYIGINELGPRKMKENLILVGLWAATQKPDLNLYLSKIIDELNDLHENGFEVLPENHEIPITMKLHTIISPVDSVERCALQNIHQFNGLCGCSSCLHPGEEIPVGRGSARIYRGDSGPIRTFSQHRRDAIKASRTGEVINGVKGISIFMLLSVFHIIRSFPPEYMHSVLIGVVKQFLTYWKSSKNFLEVWHLDKNQIKLIDERMQQIQPPCEITRTPQSLNNLSKWKASEYKNFLLYYSVPCLKGILPSRFYNHWLLLVYAISIFNSDKISSDDFTKAKNALIKFVTTIETIYGRPDMMKFNVHLLLHIPRAVLDYGAIWAWSAFPFESYNLILRSMLHSSQSLLSQVCKSYLRLQTIKFDNTFCRLNCNPEAQIQYFKMMGEYKARTGTRSVNDPRLILYGLGKTQNLDLIQKVETHRLLKEEVLEPTTVYARFLYKNMLIHSKENSKLSKRNNSVIKTTSGDFVSVIGLFSVRTITNVTKFVIIAKKFTIYENEYVTSNREIDFLNIYVKVRATNNIIALFPKDINKKCILEPSFNAGDNHETFYIKALVNKTETD